jgi:hypothetical protein
MRLKVLTPFDILVEEEVTKVIAEAPVSSATVQRVVKRSF